MNDLITIKRVYRSDRVYKDMIRNMLAELKGRSIYKEISESVGIRFRGDFYGLLGSLGIPMELYLPTLILNQLDSSEAYDGRAGSVTLISEELFDKIIKIKRTL